MNRLSNLWQKTVSAYWTVEPARFSFLIVIVSFIAFWYVDQGVDILISVKASMTSGHKNCKVVICFFAGLFYACFANWYWPRFLLNCAFPTPERKIHIAASTADALRLHVPRILGVTPVLVVGIGFLHAGYITKHGLAWWPWLLACVIIAVILYFGFIARRKYLKSALPGAEPKTGQHRGGVKYVSWRTIFLDWKSGTPALLIFILPSLAFWFLFTFKTVSAGLAVGTGCVLFLAFACWACYGALAVYVSHRYKLPVLTLILVWVWMCSFWNDNHSVRTLPSPAQPRYTMEQNLDDWYANITSTYPHETRHPLYVATAEGGGIRAGYWAALILAKLQDSDPKFADHLYAISGVSGGSLGGTAFVGMNYDSKGGKLVDRTKDMFAQDFLAPLVGKMLFPDLTQRLIPYPIEFFDRARALEQAWEHSQVAASDFNAFFTNDFVGIYARTKASGRWLPSLFLNGTGVETGKRIITSNVKFGSESNFLDAVDGLTVQNNDIAIRLSTAAHASARFTYFSPAGRLSSDNHVVDGGYFENYGAKTAMDILAVIAQKHWTNVMPCVIVIQDDPEMTNEKHHGENATSFSSQELLAPLTTLLNIRTAHAELALHELVTIGFGHADKVETYNLVQGTEILPLGWVLSPAAIEEMSQQLTNRPNQKSTAAILHLLQ